MKASSARKLALNYKPPRIPLVVQSILKEVKTAAKIGQTSLYLEKKYYLADADWSYLEDLGYTVFRPQWINSIYVFARITWG